MPTHVRYNGCRCHPPIRNMFPVPPFRPPPATGDDPRKSCYVPMCEVSGRPEVRSYFSHCFFCRYFCFLFCRSEDLDEAKTKLKGLYSSPPVHTWGTSGRAWSRCCTRGKGRTSAFPAVVPRELSCACTYIYVRIRLSVRHFCTQSWVSWAKWQLLARNLRLKALLVKIQKLCNCPFSCKSDRGAITPLRPPPPPKCVIFHPFLMGFS